MIADRRNLQIKLVRGRTQTILTRFGLWSPTYPPLGGGDTQWTWNPTDISRWLFYFTMRTNFSSRQPTVALTKNPIQNMSDPTQGILMWQILDTDTELLVPGNYVFDMAVKQSTPTPAFFCGGVIPLEDNVTDF